MRSLTTNEVDAVRQAVSQIESPIDRLRMTWVIELLLANGPRTSDLTSGRMHEIQVEYIAGQACWVWRLVGKGAKPGALPLSDRCVEALKEFRQAIGLPAEPEPTEPPYPIFPKVRGLKPFQPDTFRPMTRQGVYKRFQGLFMAAADILSGNGLHVESRALKTATTHDLRHTCLKGIADRSNGDMRLVMKMGRHSSIVTSGKYARASLADLAEFVRSGG